MIELLTYKPHLGQKIFHHAVATMFRFTALITGIRGGKTYSGARESVNLAWNAKGRGVFGIIAPTYSMLDRTTWVEFRDAARPLILTENETKKIIVLKNGRRIHGHSAENSDRIRNETFVGFWVDEARECKEFGVLWDVLMGRVLSTGGKGIVTTTPNSFDDIHKIFIEDKKKDYGVIRFPTYENTYLNRQAIDDLKNNYDPKFAKQEIDGEFVTFEGQVYYTFSRRESAGQLALEKAVYNPRQPLRLCCDFNVDPMAWVICQYGVNDKGMAEIYWIDEIFIRNSNTVEACTEFKRRYYTHRSGLYLYGDATGKYRHTSSNVTNWKIIQDELKGFDPILKIPGSNPAEKDRINAVNGMIKNSSGVVRTFVNPKKCRNLIRDFEQVSFKKGTVKIDKEKSFDLTHASDAAGYLYEKDFSLNRSKIEGLKI